MAFNVGNKIMLGTLALSLILTGCNKEEEIEREKQKAVEQVRKEEEAKLKAYKEDVKRKQTTPFTVSELNDTIGKDYKIIKKGIEGFNKDIEKLKKEEITVYDLNENVTEFSIVIKDMERVDTLKIHQDYIDFYNVLLESTKNYVTNLDKFSTAYKIRSSDEIKEISDELRKSVSDIEEAEEKVFGTKLGDKILDKGIKEELTKRFKGACKLKIDEENKEELDKLVVPEIDISKITGDELLEHKELEEELNKKRKEYDKKASKLYADCYDEFLKERANFGVSNGQKVDTKLGDDLRSKTKDIKDKKDTDKDSKKSDVKTKD